jgi:hypothetical protein
MRHGLKSAAITVSFAITLTACKKTADSKPNFESSINSYYQSILLAFGRPTKISDPVWT